MRDYGVRFPTYEPSASETLYRVATQWERQQLQARGSRLWLLVAVVASLVAVAAWRAQ